MLVLHLNPFLIAFIGAINAICACFVVPIIVSISDNFRSRWGRRRLFILVGGIAIPITCALTWTFMPINDTFESKGNHNSSKFNIFENFKKDIQLAKETFFTTTNINNTSKDANIEEKTEPLNIKNKSRHKKSFIEKFKMLINSFSNASRQDRKIVIYLIIMGFLMTIAKTLKRIPFAALAIEIAPSYHGRTKVVLIHRIITIIPMIITMCIFAIFTNVIDNAIQISWILACISIPLVVLSVIKTKERTFVSINSKKVPFFTSLKLTLKSFHLWKIILLSFILKISLGPFMMIGGYLSLYYVWRGDLLKNSAFSAMVGSFAIFLTFLAIPLVYWLCKKYGKHGAMRIAIVLMMIGCVLKWWCVNPNHPELLFIIPFFFSIGIFSSYIIIQSLIADITDVDELATGSRREAMFIFVISWLTKIPGVFITILSCFILNLSGFDIDLGANQNESVFTTMRILFSIVPAVLLSFGLLVLHKYPLTPLYPFFRAVQF